MLKVPKWMQFVQNKYCVDSRTSESKLIFSRAILKMSKVFPAFQVEWVVGAHIWFGGDVLWVKKGIVKLFQEVRKISGLGVCGCSIWSCCLDMILISKHLLFWGERRGSTWMREYLWTTNKCHVRQCFGVCCILFPSCKLCYIYFVFLEQFGVLPFLQSNKVWKQ